MKVIPNLFDHDAVFFWLMKAGCLFTALSCIAMAVLVEMGINRLLDFLNII